MVVVRDGPSVEEVVVRDGPFVEEVVVRGGCWRWSLSRGGRC